MTQIWDGGHPRYAVAGRLELGLGVSEFGVPSDTMDVSPIASRHQG